MPLSVSSVWSARWTLGRALLGVLGGPTECNREPSFASQSASSVISVISGSHRTSHSSQPCREDVQRRYDAGNDKHAEYVLICLLTCFVHFVFPVCFNVIG